MKPSGIGKGYLLICARFSDWPDFSSYWWRGLQRRNGALVNWRSSAQRYCQDLGIHFNRRDAFIHDPKWLPTYRKEEKPWIVPEDVALPGRFGHKKDGVNLAWSPLPEPKTSNPGRCSWHYGYSAISAGGRVSPCCAVPGEWNDFGAVVTGRTHFSEIWNNEPYRRSRSDFVGRSIQDLRETVCTRCPVPRFVHHMYSLHDYKVIAQCGKFIGSDPLFMHAFNLLSQSRYGVGIHDLLPNGALQPEQFFGTEEEGRIAAFVEFYGEHLAAKFESGYKKALPAASVAR
jgi:hypothetical protein